MIVKLPHKNNYTYKSYCAYIRSYLDYLSDILHKQPEDVSWRELRDCIRWLQNERSLSDRTINCAISQLRFFTIYVHLASNAMQSLKNPFDLMGGGSNG